MKKKYFLTLLLIAYFGAINNAQVTYSGNGNSGFGDVIGSTGNIQITDDGTKISFTFNRGAGNLNDTMVIYIDSKTGGFTNTSTFTDTADGLRKGVSGYDGTNRSTVNFPTGFTADYAIAFDKDFAGLWTLVGSGSHTFISSANLSPTGTATSAAYTFDVDFSEIGTSSASNFKFLVTYLNSGGIFRSDEAIGDGIASGNPGATAVTFTGDRSYPNTWTGTTDSDWATATNWSEGVPTATHNVYIPQVANQPTATAAVTINKATISSGASLISTSTFTGNITYNISTPDANWHLVSPPVTGETVDDAWVAANSLSTGIGTNRGAAGYDNSTDADGDWGYFQTGNSFPLTPGEGFSLQRTGAGNFGLTGTYTTAPVNFTAQQSSGASGNDWNLLGNPFTAYIDIATFITANTANFSGAYQALYVWDNAANGGAGAYVPKTTGYFQPGQGFFVNADAGTAITYTSAMQSHQTGVTFYRTTNTDFVINLTLTDGSKTKTTEINYVANKTTGLDSRFDIGAFSGTNTNFALYTQLISDNNGINFMRQALPNSDYENMIIPIGVNATAGAELTFTADVTNLPTGLDVYIENRTANTFTKLSENGNYTITLDTDSNGIGQFYLRTPSAGTLSVNNVLLENVSLYKKSNTSLRIVGLQQGKASIKIVNLLGKQMISKSFTTNGVSDVSLPKLATGIYIVQLQTENGKLNKKIIIE